jgi:hypothetical protein
MHEPDGDDGDLRAAASTTGTLPISQDHLVPLFVARSMARYICRGVGGPGSRHSRKLAITIA